VFAHARFTVPPFCTHTHGLHAAAHLPAFQGVGFAGSGSCTPSPFVTRWSSRCVPSRGARWVRRALPVIISGDTSTDWAFRLACTAFVRQFPFSSPLTTTGPFGHGTSCHLYLHKLTPDSGCSSCSAPVCLSTLQRKCNDKRRFGQSRAGQFCAMHPERRPNVLWL
jgi:hypothetical protein